MHRFVVTAMVAVSSIGAAQAQVAPSYPELLREGLVDAPRIIAGDADVDAARGLERQAGVRPNPTVTAEVENFAGTRPYGRFGEAEATVSVAQPVELGGKRSARIRAAGAEVSAARARAELGRVDFAYELAIAYSNAEAALARTALAREALGLAEEDARVARLLVEHGKEARARAVLSDAAVAGARGDLAGAEAEYQAALASIAALLGHPNLDAIAGGLLDAAWREDPAGDRVNPSILLARAERDAAASRIDVERRRSVPDVTVSLGVRRLEGDDATALVAGVSVPLPLFDRNRGGIDSASASARAAEARVGEAEARIEGERRAARSRLRGADARLDAAVEGETAAREAYRLARIGYEGGKMPLAELLAARRALVDTQSRTIDARLARVQAAAVLARIQGVSLAGAIQ